MQHTSSCEDLRMNANWSKKQKNTNESSIVRDLYALRSHLSMLETMLVCSSNSTVQKRTDLLPTTATMKCTQEQRSSLLLASAFYLKVVKDP